MSLGPFALILKSRKIQAGRGAGFKLVLPGGADPQFIIGDYETPMQDAIDDMLSPGDVFYDIGANLGFFSLIAARKVGRAGHVYAVEPVPRNARAIGRCIAVNRLKNVDVFAKAAGARTGTAELWLTQHVGGAALASAGAPPDRLKKIDVDLVAMDDLIAQFQLRPPSLIKIDVEGGELEVLHGLEDTLKRQRPAILCEIDDASRQGLENKRTGVCEFLGDLGYRFQILPSAYDESDWYVMHIRAARG